MSDATGFDASPPLPSGFAPSKARVPETSAINRAAFDRIVMANEPVALKGYVADWPAVGRWSLDYLDERIGRVELPLEHYPSGNRYKLWQGRRTMPLSQYLASLAEPNEDSGKLYLAEVDVREDLQALLPDIRQPALFDADRLLQVAIFLGRDTVTSAHYHPEEQAILCQVTGRKRVVLYSPSDFDRLYPHPWYSPRFNWSRIDFGAFEERTWKELRGATEYVFDLEAGDALFIPIHWWHLAFGQGLSTSITYFWRAAGEESAVDAVWARTLAGRGIHRLATRVGLPLLKAWTRLNGSEARRPPPR